MKCYKFWVHETKTIRIDGELKSITLTAGSNISKTDASANASKLAAAIERHIPNGTGSYRQDAYEVSIKEHVAKEIDSRNIITINRYGAQVLNTTKYTVLDIDHYSAHPIMKLFGVPSENTKDNMLAKFKQRITRYPEFGESFRIYETCKGIRVIGKQYVDPQTKRFLKTMRSLGVDPLYSILCKKQNCYRVRLTPKPYRMKIATIKIKTPCDCETEIYETWQKQYAEASNAYSVAKLCEVIGKDFWDAPVVFCMTK
jgi:hypothetical protein